MELWDLERFGITVDDVKSGKYSYIIGFDLGKYYSTASYIDFKSDVFYLPRDLKFDNNENTKVSTAIRIDSSTGSCGLVPYGFEHRGYIGEDSVVNIFITRDNGNKNNYDTGLLIQSFFTVCFSRFIQLYPHLFMDRCLVLVNKPDFLDGKDNFTDSMLSQLIRDSLKQVNIDADVIIAPKSIAILSYINFSKCRRIDNPIIIKCDDDKCQVDCWNLSDNKSVVFSKEGPVGMNVLCGIVLEKLIKDSSIIKNGISWNDREFLKSALEGLKVNKQHIYKILIDSADNDCHPIKINYNLINQIGENTLVADIGNKSIKHSLHEIILNAFYEYCVSNNTERYDYTGPIYIVDSTCSILTHWIEEISSKIIPNGNLVIIEEPRQIISRGLCVLGANLLQ